jgi:hypothetical protein
LRRAIVVLRCGYTQGHVSNDNLVVIFDDYPMFEEQDRFAEIMQARIPGPREPCHRLVGRAVPLRSLGAHSLSRCGSMHRCSR